MSITPADSLIYQDYLGDGEIAECFSDAAELRAMQRVEAALATAQGRVGVIPAGAAREIEQRIPALQLDPRPLAQSTARSGVVTIALVAALREALSEASRPYLHWGATSQDIIDTGLVLRVRDALTIIKGRLNQLIGLLLALCEEHRATVMVARTRHQQATPTTFGLKTAGWAAPLGRQRQRLKELTPRLLRVQFAGACGNLAALGEHGPAVVEALAQELDLAPATTWHTQRDTPAELASWLSLLTGALGKVGSDLVAMAQSEVAELRPGAGGGSSTMPQKANPIAPEALLTLARWNAALAGTMHMAMVQNHERDGEGWSLEWLSLPQMFAAAGCALNHALAIFSDLSVNAQTMQANMTASNGLVMAEGAAFALAAHMPRPQAQALVEEACAITIAQGRHLAHVLAERTDAPIDW